MSEDYVIKVENLSKAFPIYGKPTDILREVAFGKKYHDLFWALKDISFSIKTKQRIGIIGPNGSGKSTLLKIITGNLTPTSGIVHVNGKISGMLSLNSSLNGEETGLSNIRFNLILNGCPKSEIDRLTEEIVEFTELGPFIYSPVKTYSTGMNARLAFGITTALKPEILVVDEVLSVGDSYFINKATRRMIDLCDQGKALMFVSHSVDSVRMLCDTALWLDNGSIRKLGPVDYVTQQYEDDSLKQQDSTLATKNSEKQLGKLSFAQISDIENSQSRRIRVVPKSGNPQFKDTHYIRKITTYIEGGELQELSLQDLNSSETDPENNTEKIKIIGWLDLLQSEWGRFYSKNGIDCRILFSRTGRNRGGHIILQPTRDLTHDWTIQLKIESTSALKTELLSIETIDYKSGEWKLVNDTNYTQLKDGWLETTANLTFPVLNDSEYQQAIHTIKKNSQPDIEILNVSICSNNQQVNVIKEQQPFEVQVQITANRLIPICDVIILIYRSDGVYVFWQSSGNVGQNLHDLLGEATVRFIFNKNYLSGGEYYISVTCANGWNVKNNYPYSEIFDRKVDACRFTVRREYELVMFGQLNMRVPVEVIRSTQKH